MTIKEARTRAGFSRAWLSRELEIPIRTLENWESGKRNPAHWAEKLILEKIERIVEERNLKTLSYIYGEEELIAVGEEYYFGQLWDGNGDGEELLESGAVSPDNENIVSFEITKESEDLMQTLVKVTDIY